MTDTSAKFEIMELFSRYLLFLDERKFDAESFARIFTENAEVSMLSNMMPIKECKGLKEIRNIHASLYRMIKSSHHQSGDFIFLSLTDNNAEVRCNLIGCFDSLNNETSVSVGTMMLSAVYTEEGWRIQRMNRKTRNYYALNIHSKPQEVFLIE